MGSDGRILRPGYYLPIVCMLNERFMIEIIDRKFSDDRYRLLSCLYFKVLIGLSF
jgi:hypothetical protein